MTGFSYVHAANGATASKADGAGAWLTANQWWNGSSNVIWISGDNAVIGNGDTGGAVTIASGTTVGSITFNSGMLTLSNTTALQNSVLDTNASIAGNASNGLKTSVTLPRILGVNCVTLA